ncbi:hypothetical protein ASPWEDRAFT_41303 [Aspergillus wentii DTO 134E9]|uniref:AB hydrolase-1 domain-containing protein n=1 Tax=Aspergillus wentii DTO 134E9 TaxID=1073089 RepID=A0A1L9RM86_ASPWE|nr:uncharacterized protein ASPWEDRAFT_41303 [Aspergillus wentii DTO 134E9]KAI9929487.1 hypothetical protein MW887_000960 [Aspergillus wentii]OJJ36070.1 hypothetical protein ASPWEDRAFT_41303 [Aspergillus wentii DTO 134E9]
MAATRLSLSARQLHQTLPLHNGRTLGYAEYGPATGFPLLYFHGFPSSRLEASELVNIANRRKLRIIAPDRPGFGLSTFQPNRRIMDWPADVDALTNHLGLSKYAIMGGSGGGPYAVACAHALPSDRLSAVGVLAGSGPWTAGTEDVTLSRKMTAFGAKHFPRGLTGLGNGIIGTLRWGTATSPGKRWMDNYLNNIEQDFEGKDLPVEERRDQILQILFEGFAQGSRATVQEAGLLTQDWGFKLEDVSYNKIQMWHGTKDENSPIRMMRYMAERLPHCELHESDEDHYTIAQHLEDILTEFLPETAR